MLAAEADPPEVVPVVPVVPLVYPPGYPELMLLLQLPRSFMTRKARMIMTIKLSSLFFFRGFEPEPEYDVFCDAALLSALLIRLKFVVPDARLT